MAIKIIDKKDLPPPDEAELAFAVSVTDDQIDTSDIPELTETQLQEVAAIARKKRAKMQTVTLNIPTPVLERYKSFGENYTTMMADVLVNSVAYL